MAAENFLTKPYYGLKGWQWVGVVGAGAFIYFRLRGGSSSASGTAAQDTSGNTDPTAGAQGYGQGYQSGYDSGLYQGQITPVSTNPPAGTKNCRTMNDPSGNPHTVCGPGAFQNLGRPGATPVWRWVEGAPHTIFAVGAKGRPFLRPPTVKTLRVGTGGGNPLKGGGSGKVPVKK